MVVCAVAFLFCPRQLGHKVVTAIFLALGVLIATAFGGRYLVRLLSDHTAVRILLSHQRIAFQNAAHHRGQCRTIVHRLRRWAGLGPT